MDGAQRARDPRDDTALVLAAQRDEPAAYGVLFERWFDRCFDVAWNIGRNRETAAEVTQDAFLAGWEGLGDLRDPAAFGGWILRTTRNRALNRLARDRGRQLEALEVHTEERWAMTDDQADPAAATEIGDRQRLVWTAARVLGERDLSLLDLHLRHGLEPAEIATELGVTANNAHQLLFRLRGKLKDAIGAALLWREGRPTCPALASLVPAQTGFDGQTATLVRRHQRGCRPCTAQLAGQTHPERLFAALPIAVVPLALRDQVQAGLADLGVPVQSTPTSASWSGPPSGGPSSGGPSSGGPSGGPSSGGIPPGTAGSARSGRRTVRTLAAATVAVVCTGTVLALTLSGPSQLVDLSTPTAAPSPAQAAAGTGPSLTPGAADTPGPATRGTSPSRPEPRGPTGEPSTEPPVTDDPSTPGSQVITVTAVLAAPRVTVSVTGPVDLIGPNRCRSSTDLRWVVSWQVTAATSATLVLPDRRLAVDPAGGSTTVCLAPGGVAEVTADGPGGTASASDTADLAPAG